MKNKIIKILLSTMIVSLSAPIIPINAEDNVNLNSGVIKTLNRNLDNSFSLDDKVRCVAYTTANVNIRDKPDLNGKILDVIPFNTQISIFDFNDEWLIALYEQKDNSNTSIAGYVNKEFVSLNKYESKFYDLSGNKGFKSFMPYTSITHTSSRQYKIQNIHAYTGNHGIRQVNERYCVALGTAFNAEIGSYVDLILENGTIIECVLADVKDEKDTLSDNITTAQNGCVSEFIVDLDVLLFEVQCDGDISSCCPEWNSPVSAIKIYEKNLFEEGE